MTTVLDQALIDDLIAQARQSPRRRANHNFHPDNAYPAHRLLIAIEPDSYVVPHCHSAPGKDETLIVVRGRLAVFEFGAKNAVFRQAVLTPGGAAFGIDIPHGVFHTVVALEPGTVFFEAKAGPYVPVAPGERADWAPAEGDPAAADFIAALRARVA